MKKIFWVVLLLLLTTPVWGQITVPNVFVPGTIADANAVNENFRTIGLQALNLGGGRITGTIEVDNGVTIDGVDISEILGGNSLDIGHIDLISPTQPQLVVGYDPSHVLTVGVDQDGNATIGVTDPAQIFFTDPVNFGNITAASITLGTLNCTGCVDGQQLKDTGVGASTYGNATTVPRFTVDPDGRLTFAENVAISYPPGTPSYPLGPDQIPETAIIDANILARIFHNEYIEGFWTFRQQVAAMGSLYTSLIHTTQQELVIQNNLGVKTTRITLDQSMEGGLQPGAAGITFDVGNTQAALRLTSAWMETGTIQPKADGLYSLGFSNFRWNNINLVLPPNPTPAIVIVNKGGGGLDANTALGYIQGYSPNGEQIKQMGACVVSIRGGIITNVTSC